MANALIYEIIHTIHTISSSREEHHSITTPKAVQDAKKYIDRNFAGDCSLGTLSEAIHLSPNHIRFLFKETTGISPYQYVISKRISRAKQLIADGKLSMLDIAIETGFCSQSHFNKIFKEQTSKTPKEYRKLLFSYYSEK